MERAYHDRPVCKLRDREDCKLTGTAACWIYRDHYVIHVFSCVAVHILREGSQSSLQERLDVRRRERALSGVRRNSHRFAKTVTQFANLGWRERESAVYVTVAARTALLGRQPRAT